MQPTHATYVQQTTAALSSGGGCLSGFPPFLYNRDSYKFETLAVMIGAIHLFLPEGVLPTDRKMVFLDNETVLSHLISGRGGGGGLIDNTNF
jgi:uncharacterized protein (DUF779 family)